jgi:hypothetical protein
MTLNIALVIMGGFFVTILACLLVFNGGDKSEGTNEDWEQFDD